MLRSGTPSFYVLIRHFVRWQQPIDTTDKAMYWEGGKQ